MFQRRTKTSSILILLAAGCTGSIDHGSTPGSSGGTNPDNGSNGSKPLPPLGPDPMATGACKVVSPGPSPLRRLSRAEYANTVVELFGEQAAMAVNFIREARVDGFDNNAQSRAVSNLLAQEYFETAEKLSTAAVSKLGDLVACDPAGQGEPACLDRFLDGFGRRVWRRPLEPAERDSLKQVFTQGRTATFADGLQAVLQVMLLSPQFMYRLEKGVPVSGADYLRLNPYEVASRLSYLLWGSMPDATLFAAAEAGKLSSREEVKAQAQRMLADPRTARMVTTFAGQWLRLDEIPDIEKQSAPYPAFKPELKDAFRGEAEAFFNQVLWKGDGKLDTLLSAPYTFVNDALASYYGLSGVTGPDYRQVQLDPKQKAGFLTQGGLLSVLGVNDGGINSLIYRGLFVRERLLCQPVPDPPPDAPSMQPPVLPATTGRESSLARQAIQLCGACHGLMDKIGFGFENFDGIGLYRTMDRGKAIDATGELTNTDVDGAFDGAVGLAGKLVSSKDVHACLATQWFRYGYGREETMQDSCALDSLKTMAISSGGNFKDLLLALTQTDTFLLRSKGDQP